MTMCMSGAWIVHTIEYFPRFLKVWLKVPFLRVPARKLEGPFATAMLCPSLPFQTHSTLAPFLTVSFLGPKKSSFTSTVFAGFAAAAEMLAPDDGIAAPPAPSARAAVIRIARLI